MSYIAYTRPYVVPFSTKLEVINEAVTLLASYPLFTFTEWVFDLDRRIEAGWFLIGCVVFCLLFNIAYLIVCGCKLLKLRL